MATSSKLSPRLPKVIIEEIRIAMGIANADSVAVWYHTNFKIVVKSNPFPTRSSIYFQMVCIINTKMEIKKVTINGPKKDFRISLSNFFIIVQNATSLFFNYLFSMYNNTKVTLSSGELDIACNTNFILTKRVVIEKAGALFNELIVGINETFKNTIVNIEEINSRPPKITKGENYNGLPYVLLDYPAYFSKENVFALRTMFWWGNFFSITIHLSGKYKALLQENIFSAKDNTGVYICINDKEWEHHFEDDNYILLSCISSAQKVELLHKGLLKIALKYELHHWNMMQSLLAEGYKKLNALLTS
jgi:hypothetical protein